MQAKAEEPLDSGLIEYRPVQEKRKRFGQLGSGNHLAKRAASPCADTAVSILLLALFRFEFEAVLCHDESIDRKLLSLVMKRELKAVHQKGLKHRAKLIFR